MPQSHVVTINSPRSSPRSSPIRADNHSRNHSYSRTNSPDRSRRPHPHNRVRVLLAHIPRYSIRGQARLAADVGVAPSTISRLVNGHTTPSLKLTQSITDALSRRLGKPLACRDVFSPTGEYPNPSGCALCDCHGCLPAEAWGDDDVLKSEWQGQRPGDWSFAKPMGQQINEEINHRKEGK
jgi:DNA-binding XRE family transcriptional regulator